MTKHIKSLSKRLFGENGLTYTILGFIAALFCFYLVYQGKASLTEVGVFLTTAPIYLWMKNGSNGNGTPPTTIATIILLLLLSSCITSKQKHKEKSDSTIVTNKTSNVVTEITENFDTNATLPGTIQKTEGTQEQLDKGDTIKTVTPTGTIKIYKDKKTGNIKGEATTPPKTIPITGTRHIKQTAQVQESTKARVKKQAESKQKEPAIWPTIGLWAFWLFWLLIIAYILYRRYKKYADAIR